MKKHKNGLHLRPNFLIVGAAKAGTTSAAKYLNEHPDIFIPEKKELRFFVRDVIQKINPKDPLLSGIYKQSTFDEKKYFEIFQVQSKLSGEASVHYLYHFEEAIPQIKKYVGDIPIIIFLRNPVKRAISNIKFLKNTHQSSAEKELSRENEKIKKGFNSFWYYKSLGLYSKQVEAYLNNFSKVKIILFEDFIKSPQQEINKLYDFLEVAPYSLEEFYVHNKAKKKNRIFKFFVESGIIDFGKRIVGQKGTAIIRNNFSSKITEEVKLSIKPETIKSLEQYYKEDINCLETITGIDLSIWKMKNEK
jgi:hypothetical protein